jgi:hypothetical protein
VVDEATWEALLAALSDAEEEGPDSTSVAAPVSAPASSATATTSSGGSSGSSGQKPYDQLFSLALGQQAQRGGGGLAPPAVRFVQEVTITDSIQSVGGGALQETIVIEEETRVEAVAAPGAARTAWPVLMEGDGGREVHALQVVLQQVRGRVRPRGCACSAMRAVSCSAALLNEIHSCAWLHATSGAVCCRFDDL